ncbi:hypothetical protein ACJIZ3_023126 [Penstemon smallii]|uniref:Uncharacterized protein n=1 Tax=Penstemon smallii TaxID=265156 RepID=A0ABD3TNC2_9LAMI
MGIQLTMISMFIAEITNYVVTNGLLQTKLTNITTIVDTTRTEIIHVRALDYNVPTLPYSKSESLFTKYLPKHLCLLDDICIHHTNTFSKIKEYTRTHTKQKNIYHQTWKKVEKQIGGVGRKP